MSEQNKLVERRIINEVWNRGNFAVVDELIAADYVGHARSPADETHGREGYKQFYAGLRDAFPDIHFTVEEQLAEEDKVVTRWTARATHTGAFRGISPTGKQAALTGITIERIANSKVVECWTNWDALGLMQQLGIIPVLEGKQENKVKEEAMTTSAQIRDAWNSIAAGFDEFTTPTNMPLAENALRRVGLRPGVRLLDVAAGSGALSIPAARLGAEVMATDISPAMVERLKARARDEGLSNLEGSVMDGHALELEDNSFDISASQMGVMLFPDLPRGLSEMARVTRPGGHVLVVAFGPPAKAEFLGFFIGAIKTVVPGFTGLPMNPPPLPFQVADPAVLRQRLAEAGLKDIRVETVNHDLEFQSGRHMWDMVTNSNPIGAGLVANLSAEQRAEVQQVLDGMLRERSGGGPAVLNNEVNIGIGQK